MRQGWQETLLRGLLLLLLLLGSRSWNFVASQDSSGFENASSSSTNSAPVVYTIDNNLALDDVPVPYKRADSFIGEPKDIEHTYNLNLRSFLEKSVTGRRILAHKNNFTPEIRDSLVALLIDHDLQQDVNAYIPTRRFLKLARLIKKEFPKENTDTYYTPYVRQNKKIIQCMRGKLVNRYHNQRRKLKKAGVLDECSSSSCINIPDLTSSKGYFGDKCSSDGNCKFEGSVCADDNGNKRCLCTPDLPVTNNYNKCGKAVKINESCFFDEQCTAVTSDTECSEEGICVCKFKRNPVTRSDGTIECSSTAQINEPCNFTHQCEAVSWGTECRDSVCVCRFEEKPVMGSDGMLHCSKELIRKKRNLFGDKCTSDEDCEFYGAVCVERNGHQICECHSVFPITNHYNNCGTAVRVNETCNFTEQCEALTPETECRKDVCVCRFEKQPMTLPDGKIECIVVQNARPSEKYIDPAMIGILVAMFLMFITICVVLRLFSRARWRENRTIFNTPNPRLMNVSLLRENKLLHADRRGSRSSARGPSRQPSMASLRAHSPNSQGSRRGSRGSSNASATSNRSNKSPPQAPNMSSATTPMLESVTVEVQEPKK